MTDELEPAESFRRGQGGAPGWIWTAAIFLASALITVLFWIALPTRLRIQESKDFKEIYEPVARQIAAGHGILNEEGQPALRTPPGFPLFVAFGFWSARATSLPEDSVFFALRVLCMAFASCALYLIAAEAWGRRPAVLAAALWMTYPLALWLTKQHNSEAPFLIVYFLGIFYCCRGLRRGNARGSDLFLCGLLIGAAMLIRPIVIGAGVVLAAAVLIVRRRRGERWQAALVGAGVLLVGNLLAVLPWEGWIYSKTGRAILLNVNSLGPMRDGLIFGPSAAGLPAPVTEVADEIRARLPPAVRSTGDVASLLLRELREHPVGTIELFLVKLVRSFYGTDSRRFEREILWLQIAYLGLIALSIGRSWRILRRGALPIVVFALAFYSLGMTITALSIVRYMVPAMGLLFTLSPALISLGASGQRITDQPVRMA